MLESVTAQTAAAVAAGKSLEEAREAVDLAAVRQSLVDDETSGRAFDNFMPELVERAYLEARGELE